ncbi:GNAT family N-acetyltransferase [Streptomyces sp. NPDC020917]|uniref:GNAT family N-acetyltransferase n=1 Tax=Streptomyces sp. NPDC020917 TaxID=3365102 RepID=UPI003798BC19
MLIRREVRADVPAVRAITAAAFAEPDGPEPVEAALLDNLRACDAWLPELSLVAVGAAGEVTGHVVCTRARIGGAPVLGLGPISVHPDHQGHGAGSALVHAVLGAADALGEPLVGLLGSPAYYGRFGFRSGTEAGVLPPDPGWGDYFQVRALTAYRPSLRGTFVYAEPFDDV